MTQVLNVRIRDFFTIINLRKLPLLLCVFVICIDGEAQKLLIKSKSSITFSQGILGKPSGEAMITSDQVTSSALFSNFRSGTVFSAQIDKEVLKLVRVGLNLSLSQLSNWKDGSADVYARSNARMRDFSVLVSFTTPFREKGILNRLRFHFDVSPGARALRVKIPSSMGAANASLPFSTTYGVTTSGIYPTVGLKAGMEYALSNNVALNASAGYQYSRVKSNFYFEDDLSYSMFNAGISFRIKKDINYLRTSYD